MQLLLEYGPALQLHLELGRVDQEPTQSEHAIYCAHRLYRLHLYPLGNCATGRFRQGLLLHSADGRLQVPFRHTVLRSLGYDSDAEPVLRLRRCPTDHHKLLRRHSQGQPYPARG